MGIELEKNSIHGTPSAATTWANVIKLKKTVLLDMNALGWSAEKLEAMTLIDGQTLAIMNDNDFGLRSTLVDANGKLIDGDPTSCTVDANGAILNDGNCTTGAVSVRATRGDAVNRLTRMWILKFPKALSNYSAS